MAKSFMPNEIKNIIVLGHQGVGKTSMVEALLYAGKALTKKGSVKEGTSVSDYTKEEKKAKISIYSSIESITTNDSKINFIDTPGFLDYVNEVVCSLRVATGALLLIRGSKGLEVGTKKAWKYIKTFHLPTIIFVNKMDKDNVNFAKAVNEVREYIGNSVVVLQDENGNNMLENNDPTLVEAIATHNDDLMEKFLMEEPISKDELKVGLINAVRNGLLIPVLGGSATNDKGVKELLDAIYTYLPTADNFSEKDIKCDVNAPFSAFVFKTVVDPFVGKMSYVHVRSGSLKKDMAIYNTSKQLKDKIGAVYTPFGKDQNETDCVNAGDIAIVTKVNSLETNDTICDMNFEVIYDKIDVPQPTVFYGIVVANKNDDAKVGEGLKKAASEDLSISVERNSETKQLTVGCQGQMHIDTILDKIKNNYNVNVSTEDAKVPYRETIKGFADVEGRHKKQSGGAGQFGVVKIKFEPCDTDFEFVNDVFGGAVPTNFIPAVEKGLIESLKTGVLTGNPVVGIRATLYDGNYHPVDSNELSFKIAANLAFKEGCKKAKPVLLEPIFNVTVRVPSEYVGDVMSSVSKFRGTVGDIEIDGDEQIINALIPQIEFSKCVIDLKTLTQAQATFSFKFAKYSEVPMNIAEKVIAAYKASQGE